MKEKVFISYTKEDTTTALRLYNDLKTNDIDVWIDQEDLLPGQNKKVAIQNAMRESRYFISLLSTNSIHKRGLVQVQMKNAMDIQQEFPETDIYFIPVRLNNCEPQSFAITELQYVDLFPNWTTGLKKILKVLKPNIPETAVHSKNIEEYMVYELAFLWHDVEPPSIQDHSNLMTPHIEFTKQLLHDAIEIGKLKVTRELQFQDTIIRFVSKAELKRFAHGIGDVPNFLK